jgi:hypothetical protein
VLGGPVGVGTLLVAILIGPAVANGSRLVRLATARPVERIRSAWAADVLQQMGIADAVSLKTGVRGWNDFEQPLVDDAGRAIDPDEAERLLAPRVSPEQRRPG